MYKKKLYLHCSSSQIGLPESHCIVCTHIQRAVARFRTLGQNPKISPPWIITPLRPKNITTLDFNTSKDSASSLADFPMQNWDFVV